MILEARKRKRYNESQSIRKKPRTLERTLDCIPILHLFFNKLYTPDPTNQDIIDIATVTGLSIIEVAREYSNFRESESGGLHAIDAVDPASKGKWSASLSAPRSPKFTELDNDPEKSLPANSSRASPKKKLHPCPGPGCSRAFRRAADLDRHYGTHINRIVKCEYPGCGKSFTRKDKMKEHMKKEHPNFKPDLGPKDTEGHSEPDDGHGDGDYFGPEDSSEDPQDGSQDTSSRGFYGGNSIWGSGQPSGYAGNYRQEGPGNALTTSFNIQQALDVLRVLLTFNKSFFFSHRGNNFHSHHIAARTASNNARKCRIVGLQDISTQTPNTPQANTNIRGASFLEYMAYTIYNGLGATRPQIILSQPGRPLSRLNQLVLRSQLGRGPIRTVPQEKRMIEVSEKDGASQLKDPQGFFSSNIIASKLRDVGQSSSNSPIGVSPRNGVTREVKDQRLAQVKYQKEHGLPSYDKTMQVPHAKTETLQQTPQGHSAFELINNHLLRSNGEAKLSPIPATSLRKEIVRASPKFAVPGSLTLSQKEKKVPLKRWSVAKELDNSSLGSCAAQAGRYASVFLIL
jgi:hypothetical protein